MSRPIWPWVLMIVLLATLGAAWAASSISGGDIEVPDVVGMSFGVAKQEIERAGLVVGEVIYSGEAGASGTSDGQVLQQSPEAGSTARDVDKIDLTLSGIEPADE